MFFIILTILCFYLADDNNLGLILGLSLGLGIPVVLAAVGGTAYYVNRNRRKDRYLTRGIELEDRTAQLDYPYMDNEVSSTFF